MQQGWDGYEDGGGDRAQSPLLKIYSLTVHSAPHYSFLPFLRLTNSFQHPSSSANMRLKRGTDSDSAHSPSDQEKHLEQSPADLVAHEIPDPDEGLSDEERKKIDRQLLWKLDLKLIPWYDYPFSHTP